MPKKLLFLFISVLLFSCKSDNDSIDCSLVDCAVAEDTLYLQFLDSDNDDDLLANRAIDTDLIEVFDEKNDVVAFSIQEFRVAGTFMAIPVSTESFGKKSFTIAFGESNAFIINFETSYSEGSACCGPYTIIESFTSDDYTTDLVEPSPLPAFVNIYIPNLD